MNRNATRRTTRPFVLAMALAACANLGGFAGAAPLPTSAATTDAKIPGWAPRHGHAQPIVAVIGDNAGAELSDFVIPYGVLKRAGIDTVALAVHDGPFRFRPALKARLDDTVAGFDARHPEGADYVIVPDATNRKDPALLAWIAAQANKGAMVVGICDGARILGNAGLLEGKWATAHWASESQRLRESPTTHWVRDMRYVVDGNVVTSSGISAAMPTSIALVEAIAGTERASALAGELGVADWSPRHDSDAFRPRYGNLRAFAVKLVVNPYLRGKQLVGVPIADGVDEIALAVTADAYSRTGRSQAVSIAAASNTVTSRNGLVFVADAMGAPEGIDVDVVLPPLAATAPAQAFDAALAGVASRYGRRTAYGVALDFEYPGYAP